MKTLFLTILAVSVTFFGFSQSDTTITNSDMNQLIESVDEIETVEEIDNVTVEPIEASDGVVSKKDTVQIRFGKHNVEIITNGDDTQIDVEKIEDFESRWEDQNFDEEKFESINEKKHKKEFDGHWGGFDFGGNMLWNTDKEYAPGNPNFMDIRPEKSFECNINFAEFSFGFCPYIGIVTGLGLNFNDYKFRNTYTIDGVDGKIQPVALPSEDFRLSKLSTGYLTAPLLLEIQIPGNGGKDKLFIAGGLIGGVKMGEHTKTKNGSVKEKDKSDHYISPLRWGYTARIGFDKMGVFATYYQTGLFETGKGPETNPLTIGLTFTF